MVTRFISPMHADELHDEINRRLETARRLSERTQARTHQASEITETTDVTEANLA